MGRFRARNMRGTGCLVAVTLVSGCWGPTHGWRASLNDEVRDGNFAFTVTAINIGVPRTGHLTAQGTFVVVNLMVKNIGPVPRSVYCQNQTLNDPAGKRYDNAVSIGAAEPINVEPGKQVHVTCAFDVPTGTLPAAIQLHDSPYSSGATVTLLGGRAR